VKEVIMRFSIAATACCTGMLLVACNRHDAETKPPATSSQETVVPRSVSTDAAGVALSGVAFDAASAPSLVTPDGALDGPSRENGPDTVHKDTGEANTANADASTPCRVLVLGDSLSDPRSNGGGYLKAWADRCPRCQFTNIARGGAMVNQMLRALREHLSLGPPRYSTVVVFGGVNDLYSDKTAERTNAKIQRDLSSIYGLTRAHADRVIAITVAPWGGFRRWYTEERGRHTQALNQWILAAATRGEVNTVIESGPLLSCGDPERLCPAYMPPHRDGLHFGSEGQRRLGTALSKAVGERCQ
jgi:lysophospholipase L1-like esterase